MIFMVVSGVLALAGVLLIADYLWVRFMGKIAQGEITGFSEQKNFGRSLPYVQPLGNQELASEVQAIAIDHIGYLISPPILRQVIPVVVLANGKARVYGYLRLLAGLIFLIPLILVLALQAERIEAFNQALYSLVFIAVFLLGWVILRCIARSN